MVKLSNRIFPPPIRTRLTRCLAVLGRLARSPYLPALAAFIAGVVTLPASDWIVKEIAIAEEYFGEASRHENIRSMLVDRDDEPIRPVPLPTGQDVQRVALGRALFHEPALSSDGTVSCATCHSIFDGGDDGRKVSEGVDRRLGSINAPTVLNAALNAWQFWDGRAATLADQVEEPIKNPLGMDSNWEHIIAFLRRDDAYAAWFQKVFPDAITRQNVVRAIVEYEQSLVTPDSPFDRWLKGDELAISEQQKRGYLLFKKKGCIGCHQGVNVGGNLFEPLGVMAQYFDSKQSDAAANQGRFNVTGEQRDRHVFKVPGLRNVAKTAPYFHDGSAATLEDAVRVMFTYQLGIPADDEAVQAISAFLESLSADPYEGQT